MAQPVEEVEGKARKKAKKRGLKLKIKIGNPHLRRLVSGAIAGAVSRTCVAQLETIRTHLMVGCNGDLMTGLFRGDFVKVIRAAPSKPIKKDVYGNFLHCVIEILREEGPSELYRGLKPSLIGAVPYAATNYYDTLRKLYKKTFKQEEISNIANLEILSRGKIVFL